MLERGSHSAVARAIVRLLAEQLAERAGGDRLEMGFQPWPPPGGIPEVGTEPAPEPAPVPDRPARDGGARVARSSTPTTQCACTVLASFDVATLYVRNVPEDVIEKLRAKAQAKGQSLNTEALEILEEAATDYQRDADRPIGSRRSRSGDQRAAGLPSNPGADRSARLRDADDPRRLWTRASIVRAPIARRGPAATQLAGRACSRARVGARSTSPELAVLAEARARRCRRHVRAQQATCCRRHSATDAQQRCSSRLSSVESIRSGRSSPPALLERARAGGPQRVRRVSTSSSPKRSTRPS